MTKSELADFAKPMGIVFAVAGVVIFVLAFFNYLQDGKVSISFLFGIFFVIFGLFWITYGKKLKALDK